MWDTVLVGPRPDDRTGEKILDAVLKVWEHYGIRRISVELIAREAGVSHMSLYRRWPGKNDLVMAAALREVQHLLDECSRRTATIEEDEEAAVESFTYLYWAVRNHPLYIREMSTDPEGILPFMTLQADPALRIGVAYGVSLREWQLPPESLKEIIELGVRITQSLLLTPPAQTPLDTEDDVRGYARRVLVPIYRHVAHPPDYAGVNHAGITA